MPVLAALKMPSPRTLPPGARAPWVSSTLARFVNSLPQLSFHTLLWSKTTQAVAKASLPNETTEKEQLGPALWMGLPKHTGTGLSPQPLPTSWL